MTLIKLISKGDKYVCYNMLDTININIDKIEISVLQKK